jgi:hypothetical protein
MEFLIDFLIHALNQIENETPWHEIERVWQRLAVTRLKQSPQLILSGYVRLSADESGI